MRATCVFFAASVLLTPVALSAWAEDPPPIQKKEIAQSQDNLKKMAKAFLAFYYANLSLPMDLHSADGKPLTSWRVAVLPHLGEEELYKQFNLDEPWDSKHNKKLIPKMPKVYQSVRVEVNEGETFYKVFVGKNCAYTKERIRMRIPASFPDGMQRTGLIFEAGEPIIWTKPGDLPFDETKALPKLGGMFDGEFNVCMVDGSVLHIKKDADEQLLKRLIMRNDGYVLDLNKLKK